MALERLGLPADFPRPAPHAIPPSWFFEAHAMHWTVADAESVVETR